jgi:hypothetical protein
LYRSYRKHLNTADSQSVHNEHERCEQRRVRHDEGTPGRWVRLGGRLSDGPQQLHLHSFEQLFRPHFQRHLRRVGPLGRRSLPDRQPPHRFRYADRAPERSPPQALRLSQNGDAGRGPLLRRHHLHFLRAELSLLHRGIRTGRVFVSTISLWQ